MNLLISMLYILPYDVITVWTLCRMVEIRYPKLLFAVWTISSWPIMLIRTADPVLGWLRPVLSALLWLGCVLLFAKERRIKTIFAAELVSWISVAADMAVALLLLPRFPESVRMEMLEGHIPVTLAMQLVFWIVVALLCAALLLLWEKTVRGDIEAQLWRYALVPASQDMLLGITAAFALVYRAGARTYLLLLVLLAVCMGIDWLMFRAIRQHAQEQLLRQRTDFLEQQLEEQLRYYDDTVRRIEQTARMRHDLRNQMQTVYVLMEQGETEVAREQLQQMAGQLRQEGEEAT